MGNVFSPQFKALSVLEIIVDERLIATGFHGGYVDICSSNIRGSTITMRSSATFTAHFVGGV